MNEPPVVCEHGNLARQCLVCEAMAEIAQLKQANALPTPEDTVHD